MELYIHIPFCKSKCLYCDFISFPCSKENDVEKYFIKLNQEILYTAKKYQDRLITSIYIGGGTPSYVKEEFISVIINTIKENYNIPNECEITIECNPESITETKLKTYKEIGVNRISIGVQSLNDSILKKIGRAHNSSQALQSICTAKKYFDNISCDLIIGLPQETKDDISNELSILCPIVNHISIYELILEENTALYKLVKLNKIFVPNEDETQDLFEYALDIIKKYNYKRYEISNFTNNNKPSTHNLGYWTREEYLGFGAGAHSFVKENKKEIRYSNFNKLIDYYNSITETNINRENYEILNETSIKNEIIMLGLRTNIGIKRNLIPQSILEKYKKFFIIENNDNVKLNDNGMAIMNTILVDSLDL